MITQQTFAPVVLFVYARADHTQCTLDALAANPEAKETDLFIYADAARHNKDAAAVQAVHDVISNVGGFKSVTLYLREHNVGLAQNIIEGVTYVCHQYGRVIVLEDDIVTSPAFLGFMNAALDKYQTEPNVWHISGWNYPIASQQALPETFFWRTMNCWGWATWDDRWQHFKKEPAKLVDNWSTTEIERFNLDSAYDFWSQVTANHQGNLNTWAIFWYATIFAQQGLCLNPTRSFVANIGNDGSGENCGTEDVYRIDLAPRFNQGWPLELNEHDFAVSLIKDFYQSLKPSLLRRILGKIKRVFI
ncbi:sugar transferase [Shewanella baltica]|uniref:sugar transferase n=1 Tax=Shewanella baltica TaxID=62322 RepID=UPI00217F19E5|nr:sugar transferase [Shewanella baltica]MCS6206983.1 sugar transferase [Shewanella baltica]